MRKLHHVNNFLSHMFTDVILLTSVLSVICGVSNLLFPIFALVKDSLMRPEMLDT